MYGAVCIIWNNKKCFDTIDVRCKHEDRTRKLTKLTVAACAFFYEVLSKLTGAKCDVVY